METTEETAPSKPDLKQILRQSTVQELRDIRELVAKTERKIADLVRDGWHVEIFWDFDHVLMDGRSDDIFELVGKNMVAYYRYEERMLTQLPHNGPWARVARRCGSLHQTQSVITARATYTLPRAHTFVLMRDIHLRRLLAVGSQPKTGSYRVTMQEAFADNPKTFIFMVDDGEHHVRNFNEVAEEMGVTDRTEAILSPRIRLYTFEDLEEHYRAVMDPTRTEIFHIHEGCVPGVAGPRYTFQVAPRGREAYRELLEGMMEKARMEAIVCSCRDELEEISRRDDPGQPMTVERLYDIWKLLQNL